MHRFNSILVRLKVDRQRPCCCDVVSFNSILVRLKVKRNPEKTEKALFQFHTGSIKRPPAAQRMPRDHHRFNSILVRLKVNTNPSAYYS